MMDYPSLPSVSVSTINAILRYLLAHGYSPERLWQNTDIKADALDDPDYRVPLKDYHRLWQNAIEITDDPALGLHVGEHSEAGDMGLVANVLIHEDTLNNSLKQYIRLFSLVNDGISLKLERGDKTTRLYYCHLDSSYYNTQDLERTLAIYLTRGRQYVHQDICLTRVGFAHAAPDYREEYDRVFNCPVDFEQSCSFIEFESHFLGLSPVSKNPYTRSALLDYADRLINKVNRRRFSNQVKQHILDLLPNRRADVDEVAKRLHMSRQTLYRKLKLEDIAYQELVENIRREKAIEMVSKPDLPLSEVAYSLGFSELSSFSRAFKRWTGESPSSYRRQIH